MCVEAQVEKRAKHTFQKSERHCCKNATFLDSTVFELIRRGALESIRIDVSRILTSTFRDARKGSSGSPLGGGEGGGGEPSERTTVRTASLTHHVPDVNCKPFGGPPAHPWTQDPEPITLDPRPRTLNPGP